MLPRPHPRVLARKTGTETVLVSMESGEVYSLTPTASRLWELLGHAGNREDLLAAMLAEYEVEPAVLERDLDETLKSLSAAGLLVSP
jgi:hypothetical protein